MLEFQIAIAIVFEVCIIAGLADLIRRRFLLKEPSSRCNIVISGAGLLAGILALVGLNYISPLQENAAIMKWVFTGQAISGFLMLIYGCWILLCIYINRAKAAKTNIVNI